MRILDLETWERARAFESFTSHCEHPQFALCSNVDITALRPYLKARGVPFTSGMVYIVSRAANGVREFRYRVVEGKPVEHETVNPAITLLNDDESLSFYVFPFDPDFGAFADACAAAKAAGPPPRADRSKRGRRGGILMCSTIPWISFTTMTHPAFSSEDATPRIAWGKFYQEGDRILMPLSVQVHHGMMDGIHVGRFWQQVETMCAEPETFLD